MPRLISDKKWKELNEKISDLCVYKYKYEKLIEILKITGLCNLISLDWRSTELLLTKEEREYLNLALRNQQSKDSLFIFA